MATAKKTQIVITANAAVAKKVMDELQQHIDGIKQKMASLDVTTKQGQREFKKLEKELVSYNSAVSQNITNTERISNAMKNLSGTSLNELKRALSAAKSELGKMSSSSKGLKEMQGNVKALQAQIDKLTGSVHKQGGAWQTAMKNLTAYVGMFAVFNQVKSIMTGVIKKNLEYSGSLTDIRKVSGLTMKEVEQLSIELAKIDTRTSVDGLAKLAYEGSKLGMSKYGVEGLASFVRAADQINVAIGEEMGEEALPALSKMVEVMGLIPRMGIEKAMLATGSAMFKLSTTSTATSNDIVEFTKRLTGVSRTAGITTDQLLALGSASSSMMLMPEVASTAMGKFIVALQKNHNLIAKELGIPDETIKNLYASGHAMDAIVLVLEKMRDKGNMNALGGIFKDLGSDGQRLVTAMVTMSKNVDMLKDHLYESQEAFSEATAVTAEYQMQQQSAVGILERANNLWEKAFVNPEGVDSVKNLSQAWYDMSVMMTQSPIFNGTLNASLSLVIISAKTLVTLLPLIVNYLVAMGVWKTVTFFIELSKAIWTAVTAQNALNTACKVNPWVALASVVLTVIGVVSSYVNQANEAAKAAKEAEQQANAWKDTLGKAAVETANLNKKLENYKKMMNEANLTQEERQRLISRFNKDFRSYISNLGIEIKNVKDLRDHYSELAQEAQRATYYRMMEKAKQQALPKLDADRNTAANALLNQVKKLGIDRLGVSFNDIDRWVSKGANGNAVFWYLAKKMPKNESGLLERYNWKVSKGGFVYREASDGRRLGVHSSDKQMSTKLTDLWSAANWYVNATNRRSNKEKEIEDDYHKWFPEDYTPYPEEEPGTLENDAPDKDAIRQEKQEKRERERSLREELKQKQDEANAIMDNVRNFYERQINAKMEEAIGLGMDKTEQDLFVEPVRRRMNEALEQVRLALAGQANTWEQFKKTMDEDLIEKTDETGVNLSKGLLDAITSNNIDALREQLSKLAKSLNRSEGSVLSEIFAKATKNAQANLALQLKQQEARRKAIQEHDYTGIVQQNMYDTFNTMGYANPTKEETTVKKTMVDGKEVLDTSAFDKRKENIIAMYEKARKEIVSLYKIDVNTTEGQGALLKFLFGDDPDGMGKRIAQTLGDDAQEWQAFYQKLIQYGDEYTAAEKKNYDEAKKITDQMWAVNKRNIDQQEKLRKIQNDGNLFGKRTNFLSNLGLANLTADPEIELMKARMQAAEDYYAFIQANTQNQQLIDEAERARQEAELAYVNQMASAMKSRLSQMKDLVQPIEDFGAAVGQALAEMRYDAESANDAIKSALKSMLESWAKMALNDVKTQMWKAINDAGAKRAKKKAQPDIDAARANANANNVAPDFANIGTEQNPMWVRIVGDHYENANGDRVGDHYEDDSDDNVSAPRAWRKRNGYSTEDDRDGYAQYAEQTGSDVSGFTNTASQTGSAIADAATGGTSLSDAAAGIGGSLVGDLVNTKFTTGGSSKKSDKEKKKQVKEEKKHQKELTSEVKKGSKEREKVTDAGVGNITDITEQGNQEQSKGTEFAQQTMVDATNTGLNATLTAKQKNNDETLQSDAQRTKGEVTFSIAGAMAKCFEFLGPIAGPIAAAVVMSTLMGLLQWALNSALGGGKNKNSSSSTKNTKVVSGMLTYDSGNVQDLRPFVGNDGSLYWATEDSKPHDGVSLLTQPTATTINGQPSLVAENGPELVIGRETTQAMMMNNPQLLKALVNYDRSYSGRRAYDTGNIAETSPTIATGTSVSEESAIAQANTSIALLQAVNTLLQRLEQPIEAKIDMYGRGKLYDSMTKANQFMKNK